MNISKYVKDKISLLRQIAERLEKVQEALGRIEGRQLSSMPHADLRSAEFRTFSQWGEDGIIQYLIRSLKITKKIFIEFGVQNYTESSTRFLLVNDNWTGLIIDGSSDNITFIKNDPIYWQYNLKAECAFITRDNIESLFAKNGISGEIGLLSVDIDGNDYWVWKNIESVSPAIVITEYNARLGFEKALTIPYTQDFVRSTAHFSHIYYGASLRAFVMLGIAKGYAFVGCNSAGNNAFFVRRDLLPDDMRELSVEEGFVPNQFREARNVDGTLAFHAHEEEQALLEKLPLIDLERAGSGI